MTTLLVASEGGHVTELQILAKRLNIGECAWVTFDSAQSRSLFAGQQVYFAPFAGTRDIWGTARTTQWAWKFLRGHNFDTVISTGASIALAVLPLAARTGAACYYFESATRTTGPSLTGRMLEPFRAVRLFTQNENWANQRWQYLTSVFDGFCSIPSAGRPAEPKRIVVSLGLHKGFGFRRAIERIAQIIPDGTDVLWQTGDTDTSGLGINTCAILPVPELTRAIAECDAVITHAGVGSIISVLRAGKMPVIAPRRARFKEHVDDHQTLLAHMLEKRGLVIKVEADEIEWADVVRAASSRVRDTSLMTHAADGLTDFHTDRIRLQ